MILPRKILGVLRARELFPQAGTTEGTEDTEKVEGDLPVGLMSHHHKENG
jgi:hypothetical protein